MRVKKASKLLYSTTKGNFLSNLERALLQEKFHLSLICRYMLEDICQYIFNMLVVNDLKLVKIRNYIYDSKGHPLILLKLIHS